LGNAATVVTDAVHRRLWVANRQSIPVSTEALSPDALDAFTTGLSWYHAGEHKEAVAYFKRATEIDPGLAVAHLYQSNVHMALSELEPALEAVTRALAPGGRMNDRERLQATVFSLSVRGDVEEAARRLRILVAQHPNEPALHRSLAQHCTNLDRLDDAITHARAAVDLDPRASINHMMLASALAQAQRFGEWKQALARARQLVPDSPHVWASEGYGLAMQDQFDAAISAYGRLGAAGDLERLGRGHTARAMLVAGRFDESRRLLPASVVADEENNDPGAADLARFWLAQLEIAAGSPHTARDTAGRLASREAKPWNMFSLRQAAELGFEVRDARITAQAAVSLAAIEKEHPSARARSFQGQAAAWTAALAGRMSEARDRMHRSRVALNDIRAVWPAAQLAFQSALWAEALPDFEFILERKGAALRFESAAQWVKSWALAGICQEQLGDRKKAVHYFDRFLYYWGSRNEVALVADVSRRRNLLMGQLRKGGSNA
jgi:tetratricopeptide (TPR) repeat protein